MQDKYSYADLHPKVGGRSKPVHPVRKSRLMRADRSISENVCAQTIVCADAVQNKPRGFVDELRLFAERSASGQIYPREIAESYIEKMRKIHITGKLAENMLESRALAQLVLRHRNVSSKLIDRLQARFGNDILSEES